MSGERPPELGLLFIFTDTAFKALLPHHFPLAFCFTRFHPSPRRETKFLRYFFRFFPTLESG